MGLIYHLVLPEQWEIALNSGTYRPVSLETEGFIHFSEEHQVLETAKRHFSKETELIVLHVPEKRLQSKIKREAAPSGELFPHLYQELPIEMVETISVLAKENGNWYWEKRKL